MPRLEGLGYRLEDNVHLLVDPNAPPPLPGQPGAPGVPLPPPRAPPLPRQKSSVMLSDDNKPKGKPNKKPLNTKECTSIIDAMKEGAALLTHWVHPRAERRARALLVYKAKVKPFEEQFKFGNFFSPLMTDADFDGKPQVLLLGQYSTGKTTFIRHLIGRDYPGYASTEPSQVLRVFTPFRLHFPIPGATSVPNQPPTVSWWCATAWTTALRPATRWL